MSSLSRKFARASQRGEQLMKQHQGPGAYQRGEVQHRAEKLARVARRTKEEAKN